MHFDGAGACDAARFFTKVPVLSLWGDNSVGTKETVNGDARRNGCLAAEFYEELRRHYSEAEIVELGTFIGFNIGYHTFFGTLKFYPMFSPDGRLVSQQESERLYGAVPASLAGGTRS